MYVDLDSQSYGLDKKSASFLKERCRDFFEEAVEDLALPPTAVDKIILTDDVSFGARISEVQGALGRKSGYTDNNVHQAVAKTLPYVAPDSNVTNTIVIRDFVVEQACRFTGSMGCTDATLDQKLYVNVIYHEVGHCKDNVLRRDIEEKPIYTDRLFKSKEFNHYGASIVLEEVAACAHASATMPVDLFERCLRETRINTDHTLNELKRKRLQYVQGQCNLVDIAVAASLSFWSILRDYGKLSGHRLGNPNFPSPSTVLWKSGDLQLQKIIEGFATQIDSLWTRYPTWTEQDIDALSEVLQQFAASHGYKFSMESENESLHFV